MKVLEKAPAKINLSLDVLGQRQDGYHEVCMVMAAIDLADRIECDERTDDKIVLETSASYVPEDERNFAFQAAQIMKEKYAIHQGVDLFIQKQIPVAAGLAGGSSDAAATIRALNRLWNIGMSYEDMLEVARMIGSDVSFCVRGGTALATGRGEQIEPLPPLPPCWVVLVKPDVSVSTAKTYQAWDSQKTEHIDVMRMKSAVKKGDFASICAALGNALEAVTMKQVTEIGRIKENMRVIGVEGILMSGSGPTVFGLTQHESRMQRLVNSMKGYCSEVYAVRPCKPLALV
ncbi:4-(cytidine 5'-diphospho)-2-C-methyl-D-erythritol kinase [Sporolactobacillus sp. Y61]|uniref:4-diphosphocytidyl-2-C-methyl-D-erythritol kinase n=1 Tax=Sporolactobacillus sp. Y61 TaxID=3160863 RepID=A0AAU8IGN4_9BACL|nr:4-(cytidine 5'-diphospho)-2-C-methyl-D-erythritol kinase [Sporolactobacillus sp. THM19-2]RYL89821.1 4-(cytidine 5'-diphospho)-2-C-methyl-D-erythritol kinase [Sporolactobacillus sp. THM19-2]